MKKIVALLLAALIIIPMGIVLSSAAETNIAQGKTYTYTGAYTDNGTVLYPDTDNKELTDGVTGAKADIGYESAIWTGLNVTGANANKDGNSTEVVLDLAKVESGLVKFVLFAEDCGSGIGKLKTLEVMVSDDNSNFTSVGSATEAMALSAEDAANTAFGIYSYTLSLAKSISARYVKFVLGHGSNWAFVSEIQVFQDPDAPVSEPTVVDPISVFVTTFNQKVVGGAGAIFTNEFSGVVDGKVAYDAANIRWTSYLLAKPAATAGQFEITLVGENLSEGSVTIPEGGFLLAAHWDDSATDSEIFNKTKENRAAILKFNVGDKVTLKGIDLTAGTVAADASVDLVSKAVVSDYVDITGDKVADPSFTLDMTAPANYKAGDTINVVITLNNIKATNGIELVMFKLYYDATKVEPVVKNDTTTDNEQMNGFITKAPNKDKWECFGKLEEDQSRYDLSFLTGQLANVVKADGDLVITVPFKVKDNVKGSIAFQMPHKDTEANDHDTNKYYGNAGLVVVKETVAETSDTSSTTSTSSTSSTNSDVKTGDAGTIAVVMVAVLALAGVTVVAAKKRSR